MGGDERLPGAATGEERIVLHVDMDCFYAACERLREAFITSMSCGYALDSVRHEDSCPRIGCAFLS